MSRLRGPRALVAVGFGIVAVGEAMDYWGARGDFMTGRIMRVQLASGLAMTVAYGLLAWGLWTWVTLLAPSGQLAPRMARTISIVAAANLLLALGYTPEFADIMRLVVHHIRYTQTSPAPVVASPMVMAAGFCSVSVGLWVAGRALARPGPTEASVVVG